MRKYKCLYLCYKLTVSAGYQGEEIVILDEIVDQFKLPYLLQALDRFPMRVECKGGSYQLRATQWFITSNYHPSDWYRSAGAESQAALMRRLNNIVEYK